MQRFEVQFHENFFGLGSKWEEYDFFTSNLTSLAGMEIENEALASALRQGKLEFTNDEWDNFKILDLSQDSFVKTSGLYFKPVVLGPFQSHHFHNTKPLEKEPDSFSYPFEKRRFFGTNSTEMDVEERIIRIKQSHPRAFISAKIIRILTDVSDARIQLVLRKTPFEQLMHNLERYMKGFIAEKDFESEIIFKLMTARARQKAFRLQQEQKLARFELGYTRSLLAGSPVKEMTIAEMLSDEDRIQKKQVALSRLQGGAGHFCPDSNVDGFRLQTSHATYREIVGALQVHETEMASLEDRIGQKGTTAQKSGSKTLKLAELRVESHERINRLSEFLREEKDQKLVGCFRGEGKWKGHGEAAAFEEAPNWCKVLAKLKSQCKDQSSKGGSAKIRQQNDETRDKLKISKDEEQFENLKRIYRGEEAENYLGKIEDFAKSKERSGVIAVKAWTHALEYAQNKIKDTNQRKKYIFLTTQCVLSDHGPILENSDKVKISHVIGSVGFHDLASQLCDGLSDMKHCSIRYQLEVVPEHLSRPKGSKDDRVQFAPDTWQQKLLDIVDSDNSALVVAPTASGKTFISYYVMEQCLRSNDTDVVVYVAPTKALVNQVQAEIKARFSKRYRGANKLVGVFLRDQRDPDFLKAQILVTVPACLNILLLSGENVKWANQIRHIIFDEVHCIGEQGGEVWEQLLLMMEPKKGFLALSATLGNVNHFFDWLKRVEERRGRTVYLVEHHERWNDLYPWVWGEKKKCVPLNPCWVLQKLKTLKHVINEESFPKDLKLLPEHCILLYDSMLEHMDDASRKDLDLSTFFARSHPDDACWNLSMQRVCEWEARLKSALFNFPPEIQATVLESQSTQTSKAFAQSDESLGKLGEYAYANREIVPLMEDLKERGMLPAICFMLNRKGCERLACIVSRDFRRKEKIKRGPALGLKWRCIGATEPTKGRLLKSSDSELAQALSNKTEFTKIQWEAFGIRDLRTDDFIESSGTYYTPAVTHWMSTQLDLEQKGHDLRLQLDRCRSTVLVNSKGEVVADDRGDLRTAIVQVQRELKQLRAPDPEFCVSSISEEDIEEAFGSLPAGKRWQSYVHPGVCAALYRGLGVHHAGLNKKVRQAIERLFRSKKIGVVFATSTLAMGINMPSKTSVFVGDAVYLNAMNYRQMAGRAGRRGFDLRGNTVFMGMNSDKCFRLLRSDLPSLQGNLILDNSLVLRLMIREHALRKLSIKDKLVAQKGIRSCVRLINYPLFDPLADLSGQTHHHLIGKQMAHCFRFSVEYLLSIGLLRDAQGTPDRSQLEPNDLAAFVAHLLCVHLYVCARVCVCVCVCVCACGDTLHDVQHMD